jgi:hypothetical protein
MMYAEAEIRPVHVAKLNLLLTKASGRTNRRFRAGEAYRAQGPVVGK